MPVSRPPVFLSQLHLEEGIVREYIRSHHCFMGLGSAVQSNGPLPQVQKHPEEYELFSGIIAQVMKLLRINVSQFLMVFVL